VRHAECLGLFVVWPVVTPHSLRVGTRPTRQPRWFIRCSWATRNASPIRQRHSATQHIRHKSAKELLSLAPLFFHVPSYHFYRPKVPRWRRTSPAVSRRSGATRTRLASISHHQFFSIFLFLKSLDARSNCTPSTGKSSQGRNSRQDRQTKREKITGGDCI
jgi:hypothetical protein